MSSRDALQVHRATIEEQASAYPSEWHIEVQDARSGNPISRTAVLIPAWNPDPGLVQIVTRLAAHGFAALIVVDDGSGPECASTFSQVEAIPSVHLIRHSGNLGKGRALKSGIRFFLSTLALDVLVTADADGQHAVEDIVLLAKALHAGSAGVALGTRIFAKEIPLRSRFGNLLTRRIFGFVTGSALADTQTGLRAFPRHVLPGLLALGGERYEYEMTVLAHLCGNGVQLIQVPVQTIYLEGNRSSHFNPLRDSMRVYAVLLRFFVSQALSAALYPANTPLAKPSSPLSLLRQRPR